MTGLSSILELSGRAPSPLRIARPRVDYDVCEPPSRPPALSEGYDAARAGMLPETNPYAFGLPSDNESLAMLWDDGFRVGDHHPGDI